MYVKNAAGEWVYIGKPLKLDVGGVEMVIHGTPETDAPSPFAGLARLKAEDDLRRSTYERPSDDELRARIRTEFGV